MRDLACATIDAGSLRDVRNRFETAVFLIAHGLVEKDALYEADQHKYPYSASFRHGLGMLAALCVECSDCAEELLPTFNESDFIRDVATLEVRDWASRWRDEYAKALENSVYIDIGPLACVDSGYFAPTDECYEVLRFAEQDVMGAYQERKVYEFLRSSSQELYVLGRRALIRHPLLTWDEYIQAKTGLLDFWDDALDQGESALAEPVWLEELLSMAYERVPVAAKKCPSCGWTMTMRGLQSHCSSPECAKSLGTSCANLEDVAHDAYRLTRGAMHYIASPGRLEVAIAELAGALGLKYEMWPLKDACDVMVTLADGRKIAVDAKAYGRAERLAREICADAGIARLCADEVVYVVPDHAPRDQPGYCKICNAALSGKRGYLCMTYSDFAGRLKAEAGEGRQ